MALIQSRDAGTNLPTNRCSQGPARKTHDPHPDRVVDARRKHCSTADVACKRPISRSRAARAGVIKGDANAADRHTAYGGRPETDHARPCRSHFPQVRAGVPVARQKVARRGPPCAKFIIPSGGGWRHCCGRHRLAQGSVTSFYPRANAPRLPWPDAISIDVSESKPIEHRTFSLPLLATGSLRLTAAEPGQPARRPAPWFDTVRCPTRRKACVSDPA
jgi:hypothetical protein